MVEQTNFANELKKKLIEQTTKTEKIASVIGSKQTEIDQLQARIVTLQSQYRAVMASSDKQKAAATLMEDRLKHSATTIINLQTRIETLQFAIAKATANGGSDGGGMGNPDAFNASGKLAQTGLNGTLTSPLGKSGKVGQMASKTSGQRVSEMLKSFKIDEQTAMAMAKNPMTLLTKLADIFAQMQDAIAAANDTETVEKYNMLSAEHRTMIVAKEKILRSFITIMNKVQDVLKLSDDPLVKKSLFMTEGEEGGEGAGGDGMSCFACSCCCCHHCV